MLRFSLMFASMFSIMTCLAACKSENVTMVETINEQSVNDNNIVKSNKVRIKIGASTFTATLSDNPTATAFKALLPLTIKMDELNNNEKFAQLPKSIPTNATVPASIQAGDLMLYGSNTLVLFYKGFSTSYSYTKIGKIDNVTGLVAALGTGSVTVSYEVTYD